MRFFARIEALVDQRSVVHQHAFTTESESEAQEHLTATLGAIQRDFVRKIDKQGEKKERGEPQQRSAAVAAPSGGPK